MFSKIASFASVLALVTCAVGCAAASTEEAATSEDAVVTNPLQDEFRFDGSFKLYDELTGVDPMCDVHTLLDLASRGGALTATLQDNVEGVCKISLDAEPRTYVLKLDRTDCGSRIYKGVSKARGMTNTVEIVDHRTRVCRDVVPATIIVSEHGVAGAPEARTMFSSDGPGIIGLTL